MQQEGIFSVSTYFNPGEPPAGRGSFERPAADQSLFQKYEPPVLVLSRDQDTRLLLATLLELWNLRTITAADFDQFLALAPVERPRLILLDSILPFANNFEVIRRIRRGPVTETVPLIVLSGFSQPAFRNYSLAMGADDYLVKPLDFDRLEKYLQTGPAHRNAGRKGGTV